jgi:predicted nucleotidyltransferase
MEVMSLAQTWFARVMARFRSRELYLNAAPDFWGPSHLAAGGRKPLGARAKLGVSRIVTITGSAMVAAPLLAELKERLASSFGDRLRSVVLFGSEARGEAGPESDIDLLVVLDRLSNDYGDELECGLAAVYPVAVRLARRVSVKPVGQEEYERGDSPLLREVRRTGVAA